MDNAEVITRFSVLLNRGVGSDPDTAYFQGKKHDELVSEFQKFLEKHATFLANPTTQILQGPNDYGTDLIVTLAGRKVGFQIKSHFDIGEESFSTKLLAQCKQSEAHNLIKWYLLICGPIKAPPFTKPKDAIVDSTKRIRYVLSEFSLLNSSYAAVYSPWHCSKFFGLTAAVEEEELRTQFHQWHYAPDDLTKLLREMKEFPMSRTTTNAPELVDQSKLYQPHRATSLTRIASALEWDHKPEQIAEILTVYNRVLDRLAKLAPKSRRLLVILVEHCENHGEGGMTAREIANYVGLSINEVIQEVQILIKRDFIDSNDTGNEVYLRDWGEWTVHNDLKAFCTKTEIGLEDLIVHIKFNLMD